MKHLPNDFARALLDAAHADAPPAGAKVRALAALASPVAAAAGTTAPSVAGKVALGGAGKWLVVLGAAATLTAGAAVVRRHGASTVDLDGRDEQARLATTEQAPVPERVSAPTSTPGEVGPNRPEAPAGTARTATESATSCRDVHIPDGPPKQCSTRGRPTSIDFVNGCSSERVEVYWVDYDCKEVFYRPLAPGETLHQSTFDTHPWRVREAGTHRLLKEVLPTATPLAADAGATAPVSLPELVVDDASHAEEGAPRACSIFGDKATLPIRNARTRGAVDVFWVDYDCHEQFRMRLEPGKAVTQSTFDAHPWRVRDAASGALLVDDVPARADEGPSYVYVP